MKALKRTILPSIILFALVSSCVIHSLHPLYTSKDLILDKRMEGSWVSDENLQDESIWNISKSDVTLIDGDAEEKNINDKRYRLEHTQHGQTVIFDLFLLKLGDQMYLDFYPDKYPENVYQNEWGAIHVLPVHTFAKVSFQGDQIAIHPFNEKFIEELIKKNKIRISHEKVSGNFLLTASSEELQKFVMKYADDKNAYDDEPLFLLNPKSK